MEIINKIGVSNQIKNILLTVFGTLILTLSAKVQTPLAQVPVTMQTFAVLFLGMAFGYKIATATVILYLIEGAFGFPVFAKGGGLMYLAQPTAGYLFGMTIAAGVIGFFAERGYASSYIKSLVPLTIGTLIIFALGVGYLGTFIGFDKAIILGLFPFWPSEVFKIALAMFIVPSIWKYINK